VCKEFKSLFDNFCNEVEKVFESPWFLSFGAFATVHTGRTIIYIPGENINHGIFIPEQEETVESSKSDDEYELLGITSDN